METFKIKDQRVLVDLTIKVSKKLNKYVNFDYSIRKYVNSFNINITTYIEDDTPSHITHETIYDAILYLKLRLKQK
jgi:hypothetical protein